MSVSPAKTLAALATSGENLGYTVLDVRPKSGLLLMASSWKLTGLSLGFISTARIQGKARGSSLSVDVTPRLGFWSTPKARNELDALLQEFQTVLDAPRARIRGPKKKRPGERPLGFLPEILASVWAVLSILVYGLMIGGWGWVPALAGAAGGGLLFASRSDAWWNWLVTGLGVLSLPFGAIGFIARRLSLVAVYWEALLRREEGERTSA